MQEEEREELTGKQSPKKRKKKEIKLAK